MITRCYSKKYHKRKPHYLDVYVCEQWLIFSNFRKWIVEQELIVGDLSNYHLDKDILSEGNKLYSPDNCVFVHHKVNSFIVDCKRSRGDCLLGCYKLPNGKYRAKCNNTFMSKQEHLGEFVTQEEAHLAWAERKYELAVKLSKSKYVDNPLVGDKIVEKYERIMQDAYSFVLGSGNTCKIEIEKV